MRTFEELQDDYGYVEITKGSNGYPSNITRAISCNEFETFEKLQEFANENQLEIIQIHQKDGWSLWEKAGVMYRAFEVSEENFGDDYRSFVKMDEDEFIEDFKPLFEDVEDFEKLEEIIKEKKEIWEQIEAMEDDEIVIIYCGSYYETYKKQPMCFSEDTHTYSYALIEN